jgi:hypothetical protein
VIGKVGRLGFKLDDALGSANGNGVVTRLTRLGPNVLFIKTNEEVRAVA